MDLEEQVFFNRMVSYDQLPQYVNLADLWVSPFVKKRDDRVGLSPPKVYEYMACGKAIVKSRVAGLGLIQ